MVYLSGSRPKRSPGVRVARIIIGILAVAAIVYGLSSLPYDVLRMERHRLFGEMRTIGRVTALRTDVVPQEGLRHFIDYKYIDGDGLARQGTGQGPPRPLDSVLYRRQAQRALCPVQTIPVPHSWRDRDSVSAMAQADARLIRQWTLRSGSRKDRKKPTEATAMIAAPDVMSVR